MCLVASLLFLSLRLARVAGHEVGQDAIAYFDAHLPDNTIKCNKNLPITGWTATIDRYRPADGKGKQENFVYFNAGTGIYTTPAAGVYHCCATFRCKQGGVCDFTFIRNAGTNGDVVYGAFGTRVTLNNEWSTVSSCITSRCKAGVEWKLNLESGGSNDCIEETTWRYSRFTCFLATNR